jgi:1-acyl-sn-glycerol-3-phosphate acyltransferase
VAYTQGARIIRFRPAFPPFFLLFHLVLALVRLFDRLVYSARINGRENMRAVDQAVLVSNHTLLLDPGLIAHAIRPRRTYFTMLEETALIPWLGTFVRLLGGVPIPERPDALRILSDAANSAVNALGFLHFFPEGECFRGNQELMPFHPGAFLIACRLGVPIIPVTTVLHRRTWRGRTAIRLAGRVIRLPPRVTIVVGRPVDPQLHIIGAAAGVPGGGSARSAARTLAATVRSIMQETIDREGGSKDLYRGVMPRLVKHREAAMEMPPARHGVRAG